MADDLDLVIPDVAHPLVDRYRQVTSIWYPWLVKLTRMLQGIANGNLIVDGAISSRTLATGAVTADAIAANSITTDALNVANIDVLDGTFGTLRTNDGGSTYIEIDDAANQLTAYVGGVQIASIGADVITNGAFITCASPSATWYPATFYNISTTGGLAGDGGGALFCQSVAGYTIEANQTTNQAGNWAGNFRNTTGGHIVLGGSAADSGYAAFLVSGTIGPFTASHPGLMPASAKPEVGDIVVDVRTVGVSIDDALTEVALCSQAEQVALGVYAQDGTPTRPAYISEAVWRKYETGWRMPRINGVGEGAINVCGLGGTIQRGDLICTSPMIGKGMRQVGDVIRSTTVAVSRETVVFDDPRDTAMIACIYKSG
jgi:hypothetical protein